MAGTVRDVIGVGTALRKAREMRGITLDAASRDTKLHVNQLRALEAEEFDALLGDVYVRGSLRTYAQYLGVSPDKVIAAYTRHADEPEPPPPPAKLGRVERAIAATRVRDNQRLMTFLAITALAFAVVFGLVSRGRSAPPPAALPTVAAAPDPAGRQIDAVLKALRPVNVVVVSDGLRRRYSLSRGETRTFMADTALRIEVMDGGAVRLMVDGVNMGVPGSNGVPWRHSYSFDTTSASPPGV